ncbi:DUF2087 domain-containing protein [Chitinimonas sp.]|uniref:DUF2087 domain-containing protein n=1 Tax=Chitinimonas sp. TaxID=1934313 RepID=UPI002F931483
MSRPVFPFHAADISLLARSLCKQWQEETTHPGHVQMLNMLARAIGFQNFQHFRDQTEAIAPLNEAPSPAEPDDAAQRAATTQAGTVNANRLLRHFDQQGRLQRWPGKFSEQLPVLWTLWARIPARRDLSEREVNDYIRLGESLGDHVLLRRELVNYKLLSRTLDGRVYRRLEQPLPPELLELVRTVLGRSAA